MKTANRRIWQYDLSDFQRVNSFLEAADFTSLLNCNINQAWSNWNPFCNGAVHTAYNNTKEVWLNAELMKYMHARKCAKRSGKLNHWRTFRMKEINKLKCTKRNYFSSLNTSDSDQKAF